MATVSEFVTSSSFDYAPENRVRDLPRHPQSGKPLSLHYFVQAFRWTGLLFLAGGLLFCAEWLIGIAYTSRGVATEPFHLVARVMGFAHYTIATYFLLTSAKIRNLRGMTTLVVFIGFAALACFTLYSIGGYDNRVAFLSVGLMFLVHGLRDETFFYRLRSGKALTDAEYPSVYRSLIWLQVAGLALVSAITYPVYIYGFLHIEGHRRVIRAITPLFPDAMPMIGKAFAVGLPFAVVGLAMLIYVHRRHPGGILPLLRSHWPFTAILSTYLFIAMLTLVAGIGVIFLLVMVHFVGWFVFAATSIAQKSKESQQAVTWRQPNRWIRDNLTGFIVFHTALCVFFFALIAANHWVFNHGSLHVAGYDVGTSTSWFLDTRGGFIYVTVVHLVLAFMPKPKPKRN